jgi:TPR repeat protein
MIRLTGKRGDADPQEASPLIEKADEQNIAAAQTQLASMFEIGPDTTQDFAQAFQWYVRQAALDEQGPDAQFTPCRSISPYHP